MEKTNWILSLLFLVACSGTQEIKGSTFDGDLSNKNIEVLGTNYVNQEQTSISFERFSDEVLALPQATACFNADKAKTNSGIVLRFTTASPSVELTFAPREGINRGADFAAYRNGEQVQVYNFNQKQSADTLRFTLTGESETAEWKITMPSLCNMALVGLQLADGFDLLVNNKQDMPVYIALGNSITHGVGQKSSTHLTYPFLLSEKLDASLYNLAVGGAKVSLPIAEMLSELPQAEIITLLIGYNDLHSNNKSVAQFSTDYAQLLATIRQHQPNASVYCISMTYTKSTGNTETGIVPDDYRKVVKEVVQEQAKTDRKLHFVAGENITSEANLREDNPNDKVHFSIEGAALFADEMFKTIESH